MLLSSLGVTTEKFLEKQKAYHEWILRASDDWEVAFDLLSGLGRYQLAERLLLDGIDSKQVREEINKLQNSEIHGFKKNDRMRVRMLVAKSRFLFGICDPYGVLREGEVHVRLTAPRKGATTLTNVDVLVVRNPCLHPGDCLKLRAVHHPKLSHLVDCIVFATQGRRAAPSMSSGGDLGQFLTSEVPYIQGADYTTNQTAISSQSSGIPIWYPLRLPRYAKYASYLRSAINEFVSRIPIHQVGSISITISLVKTLHVISPHIIGNYLVIFPKTRLTSSFVSISLGRITALHARWMRYSPKGAMCDECQELNALHSSVVDGASIKIPERLTTIPQKTDDSPHAAEPFVLDALHEQTRAFLEEFQQRHPEAIQMGGITQETAETMILSFLSSEKLALSEYETVTKAAALAVKHSINLLRYVSHIDFSALSVPEKYAVSIILNVTPEEAPYIWNRLVFITFWEILNQANHTFFVFRQFDSI